MRSGDSYKTENADDGKVKAETPAQGTVRLERETSKRLHTCAFLSVSPSLAFMYVSFSVTSHKPFSTLHSAQDLNTLHAYGHA